MPPLYFFSSRFLSDLLFWTFLVSYVAQPFSDVLLCGLCEMCPNTEFFLVCIFPYSVRIRENRNQENFVFEHFSRSGGFCK